MTPSHAGTAARTYSKRLTGAHAGRVLSREIEIVPGAEAVGAAEGHTRLSAEREERRDLARSYDETPSMRGDAMCENRETLRLPWAMVPRAAVGSPRTSSTDARLQGV
jgi:hypothetical protein